MVLRTPELEETIRSVDRDETSQPVIDPAQT
jgi:hypothetical protein